jgi:hypothetical protein
MLRFRPLGAAPALAGAAGTRPLFERLAKGGFHLSPDLVAAVLAELGED